MARQLTLEQGALCLQIETQHNPTLFQDSSIGCLPLFAQDCEVVYLTTSAWMAQARDSSLSPSVQSGSYSAFPQLLPIMLPLKAPLSPAAASFKG